MVKTNSTTLLHAAVTENNLKAVQFLLEHGANPNTRAPLNNTPPNQHLHDSSKHRSDSMSNMTHSIISKFRRTSFSASITITPNPLALTPGSSYSFSRSKRSQSTAVNYRSTQLRTLTPMHIAAVNGRVDIMELLINHGGDMNAIIEGGYSPLMVAALYRNLEVMRLLVRRGANVNACSRNGKTVLYFAVKTKQLAIVSMLLENSANPDAATNHGVTPLHVATERKLIEIVEVLLLYGANVNVTTKTGVTPLHCAAVQGQTEITELLLKYGGDVSVIMKKGEIDVTPLLWVTETERRKIIDLVLKYAAKTKGAGFYGTFFKKIWKKFGLKKL